MDWWKMRDFLASQLDFIFFFYGFSFILLGAVCFTIARGGQRVSTWALLGAFAFLHGACEWMDLIALSISDTPAFTLVRTLLMAASFGLLMEFGRGDLPKLGQKAPGRWIYGPILLILVFAGLTGSASTLNAAARYTLGLPGALLTSWVFLKHARKVAPPLRFWALAAAAGFMLYGLCAGAIVPPAPFWPANAINHAGFAQLTGVPIQLVRGVLATLLTFSIWTISGRLLAQEIASERYSTYLRHQFLWTVTAVTLIFAGGWDLTQRLGDSHQRNVAFEAQNSAALLSSQIQASTTPLEVMSQMLAGLPSVAAFLEDPRVGATEEVKAALRLHVLGSGATQGYILDTSDRVVAQFGEPGSATTTQILSSAIRERFTFEDIGATRAVYSRAPIRTPDGRIVGQVVLKSQIGVLERALRAFPRPYFVIDTHNVIRSTNRAGALNKVLWAISPSGLDQAPSSSPVFAQKVVDSGWVMLDGHRNYVRRQAIGGRGWSLIVLVPSASIVASRALGIIITLLLTVMWLIYLLGREHAERDAVLMDRRLQLQTLARDLGRKASTDTLTGLGNRLKLDETLAAEIHGAQRYETPLSVVICDVDHFKHINDTQGHPVGDRVLARLAQLLRDGVRNTDLVARWGGEEFVIVCPHANEQTGFHVAEKLRGLIENARFDGVGAVHCSFGVTAFEPGDTPESLVARADAALYRAKQAGRNRVERSSLIPHRPISVAG